MKSLFFVLIFLFTCAIYAQDDIGSTTTPYDTTGWDAPEDTTIHYGLPIYRLLSNPGGWINISQRQVDSLLWELIVYTKLPLYIENDTLKFDTTGLGSILIQDASVTWAKLDPDVQDSVQIAAWWNLSQAVRDSIQAVGWYRLTQQVRDSIQVTDWYRLAQAVRDSIQKGITWDDLEQAVKDSIANSVSNPVNVIHAFLQKTTDYTPSIAVAGTYVKVTPTLTHIEKTNVTVAGDTITIVSPGDYFFIMDFTYSGDANDDYTLQIRKNYGTVSKSISFSASGVTEYGGVSLMYYFEDLVAGDDISFYITNTVDVDDPTFSNMNIYFKKEHN